MSLRATLWVRGQPLGWADVATITPEGAVVGCGDLIAEHTEITLRLPVGEEFIDLSGRASAAGPGRLRLNWGDLGAPKTGPSLGLARRLTTRPPRPRVGGPRRERAFRRRGAPRGQRRSILLVTADPALRARVASSAALRGCALSVARDVPAALVKLGLNPNRHGLIVDLRLPLSRAGLLRPLRAAGAPMPILAVGLDSDAAAPGPMPLSATGEVLLQALLGPTQQATGSR